MVIYQHSKPLELLDFLIMIKVGTGSSGKISALARCCLVDFDGNGDRI
jgi:hypothetical protein